MLLTALATLGLLAAILTVGGFFACFCLSMCCYCDCNI